MWRRPNLRSEGATASARTAGCGRIEVPTLKMPIDDIADVSRLIGDVELDGVPQHAACRAALVASTITSALSRPAQRLTCTVAEACEATGLGRTKLYELVGDGQVDTTTIGRRRLVQVRSLRQLLKAGDS